MTATLIILASAVAIGLGFAAYNFYAIKRLKEGNETMQRTAAAIRLGAKTFIAYEYKVLAIVIPIVAIIEAVVLQWYVGAAFIIGAVMSALAGWIGMKIATYANVRVTNEANESRNLGTTLKVAFRGGSVVGICVGGFALLGILLVFVIFGLGFDQINSLTKEACWLTKIEILPFPNALSGYALGCSTVAMFNRIGGGIYTKAADMGADLVGKTEARIEEDDPRNPATIADNVGDNVGDVAGLGSDLLESFVASIVSSIVLAFSLYIDSAVEFGTAMLQKLYMFPVIVAAIGLVGCVLGIAFLLIKNLRNAKNVHMLLNSSTYIAAGITIVGALVASYLLFGNGDAAEIEALNFKAGWISPWIAAVIGVAAGIIIGVIAEYYTSADYKPTKVVAESSKEGSALTITSGLALGMSSCMTPCIVLGVGIIGAYMVSGFYGVALSALGMLSFVAATVTVDSYGPISDNAGGIAEMAHLDHGVREITDTLDSVGNTTAAIGKGFAIGSGGLAALSLLISYMYSYNTNLSLNIVDPMTLAGAIVGGAIPFFFSGMLIDAVAKTARTMVDEIRRQFKQNPGILQGTAEADYKTCIGISAQGALKEMKTPALLAVVIPVVCGLLFGAEFVGGLLIGGTITAIMIALFTGNSGGAWDNAKKYIECGGVEGAQKGDDVHAAAVVGDTVGDPLKDTVGPCMDIFIKIMATVALVAVSVFSKYNLWDILGL